MPMLTNEAETPSQPCRHLHATNYDPAKVVYGQPIIVLENGQGWCLDCKTFFMPDKVVRYIPANALRLRQIGPETYTTYLGNVEYVLASALVEVWEKAIAALQVRAKAYVGVSEVTVHEVEQCVAALEAARDAALSAGKGER